MFVTFVDIDKFHDKLDLVLKVGQNRHIYAERYSDKNVGFLGIACEYCHNKLVKEHYSDILYDISKPLDVIHDKNGAPIYSDKFVIENPGIEKIHFSYSHSGTIAACAISERPVGVDVQEMVRNKMSIAKRFYTDTDNTWIFSADNKDEEMVRFYKIWCAKESFLKASGLAGKLSMRSFSVVYAEDGVNFRVAAAGATDFSQYEGKLLEAPENMILAVCEKIQ